VASSIPTYREMQRALLVKSPRRALPVVSGAPATKWQAADRMVKALTGAFMENRRRKREEAGIGEARSVLGAFSGVGRGVFDPLEQGALSEDYLQTVADPTFSAEDIASAGSDLIQVQGLPPMDPIQQAMDAGADVSIEDQAQLARRQELAGILAREDEQVHLGRVEAERAPMIAQNVADLPGAQAELDALNEAGEGFRPLNQEELAARNELGLAEWEAANPIGMAAVDAMDLQTGRGKDMRLALLGEQRAIDMGVGDDNLSSMEKNVALYLKYQDAFNKAKVGLRDAEDSGDEEAIALATGVFNQADSDYEAVRRLFPRDPQTAREVSRATAEGKDAAKASFVIMDTGQAASTALPRLRRALALLEGGEKTGGYNSWLNYAKNKLGLQDPDAGELMNLMQLDVLTMLKPTFGAAFTEKEGRLLTDIMVSFKKNVPTNIRLLENAIEAAEIRYQAGLKEAEDLGRTNTVSLMKAQYNVRYGPDAPWGEGAGDDEGGGNINALSEEQIEKLIIEGGG
jgi:hypothetical protein